MASIEAREKDFRRLKLGKGLSLYDLLEVERQDLYDYLLRMTGQISRSDETVDEVFQAFTEDMLESIQSYNELKISLFVTARKFNADIWSADTAKLINLALEPLDDKKVELQRFIETDVRVRSLPAKDREVLILGVRQKFAREDIKEITGFSLTEIDGALERAQAIVSDVELVRTMPSHPLPVRSRQETQNLSIVMRGIKTKPVGVWSPVRIAVIVLVVALAVVWLVAGDKLVLKHDDAAPVNPLPPVAPAQLSEPSP